jgi:hypothetical protein
VNIVAFETAFAVIGEGVTVVDHSSDGRILTWRRLDCDPAWLFRLGNVDTHDLDTRVADAILEQHWYVRHGPWLHLEANQWSADVSLLFSPDARRPEIWPKSRPKT